MNAPKKTTSLIKKYLGMILLAAIFIVFATHNAIETGMLVGYIGAVLMLITSTLILAQILKKEQLRALRIRTIDSKTGKATGSIGLEIIFAVLGAMVIIFALIMWRNPIIFMGVYIAVVAAIPVVIYLYALITKRQQSSIWKKTPAERLEIWNEQFQQGKFKHNPEFYYHYLANSYGDMEDYEQALQHNSRAISLTQAKETPAVDMLDLLFANQANYLINLDRWQEAAEILEPLELKQDVAKWLRYTITMGLARVALMRQDIPTARKFTDETTALSARQKNSDMSWLLILQAEVAFAEGNIDEAMQKASDVMRSSTYQPNLTRARLLLEKTGRIL